VGWLRRAAGSCRSGWRAIPSASIVAQSRDVIGQPRSYRWTGLGVALCLLGSIVGARDVSGHAVPASSDPASNATLSEAPHEVIIRFSERIDARASRLEVLDAHGQRVDHGDATVDAGDPWRYRVGVHGIADGVYTVAWRVLSADDGHVTDGAHVFAVGVASAPSMPARVTPRGAGLRPLARWVTVVGCALLLGVPVARGWLSHGNDGGSFARILWIAGGMVRSRTTVPTHPRSPASGARCGPKPPSE
jgi:copper transport protein